MFPAEVARKLLKMKSKKSGIATNQESPEKDSNDDENIGTKSAQESLFSGETQIGKKHAKESGYISEGESSIDGEDGVGLGFSVNDGYVSHLVAENKAFQKENELINKTNAPVAVEVFVDGVEKHIRTVKIINHSGIQSVRVLAQIFLNFKI
jgi:hypothetical protein